jgi:hypothetical protein
MAKGMRTWLAIGCVTTASLVACGGDGAKDDATYRLRAFVRVPAPSFTARGPAAGDACEPVDDYLSLSGGHGTVRDENGAEIASAPLSGRLTAAAGANAQTCEVSFSVAVPESEHYSVNMPGRATARVAFTELARQDWRIEIP